MTASASDGEGGDIIARTSSGMPVRIVTAAAIFDGHDAAINIMRRIFQSMGAEVIHLGHDRSAEAVARAAIEEDVHAIAITSYQGGAVEFFTATKQILDAEGFEHVVLLGGGGAGGEAGALAPRAGPTAQSLRLRERGAGDTPVDPGARREPRVPALAAPRLPAGRDAG